MRILLIDDEPAVTDNLRFYFEMEYHAVQYLSWIEDEDIFLTQLDDFQPEGVILDFEVTPRGDEILNWIRRWEKKMSRRPIPVVFYTKYADSPTHRKMMMDAGVTPHQIVKKQEVGIDIPALLHSLRNSP